MRNSACLSGRHVGPPDLPTVHTPQLTFISLKKIEAEKQLTLPDKPFINTTPVHRHPTPPKK